MPNDNLNLSLIYEERTGDFLFLMGTILAFVSNFQAEESLRTEKNLKVKTKEANSLISATAASLLFFLASILFSHVAIIRFAELKSNSNSKTSPEFRKGTALAALGNIVKSAGFGIAAIASLLKLSDVKKTS